MSGCTNPVAHVFRGREPLAEPCLGRGFSQAFEIGLGNEGHPVGGDDRGPVKIHTRAAPARRIARFGRRWEATNLRCNEARLQACTSTLNAPTVMMASRRLYG
jgi:hypothetical protein